MKNVLITSSIFGTMGTLCFSLNEDFDSIARSGTNPHGPVVRYRFQQICAFDGLRMGYKKEVELYDNKSK